MASTYLYEYEVNPGDIMLRQVIDDTPVIIQSVDAIVYGLETVVSELLVEEFKLYEYEVVPEDIRLREDVKDTNFSQSIDILLRVMGISIASEEYPPTTYFGILKFWNGSIWIKKLLKIFTGSFILKPLKMWDSTDWKLIDTGD